MILSVFETCEPSLRAMLESKQPALRLAAVRCCCLALESHAKWLLPGVLSKSPFAAAAAGLLRCNEDSGSQGDSKEGKESKADSKDSWTALAARCVDHLDLLMRGLTRPAKSPEAHLLGDLAAALRKHGAHTALLGTLSSLLVSLSHSRFDAVRRALQSWSAAVMRRWRAMRPSCVACCASTTRRTVSRRSRLKLRPPLLATPRGRRSSRPDHKL